MPELRLELSLSLFEFEDEIWWRLMSEHVNTWQEFDTPNPVGPCLCMLPAPPAQKLTTRKERKKGHCIEKHFALSNGFSICVSMWIMSSVNSNFLGKGECLSQQNFVSYHM